MSKRFAHIHTLTALRETLSQFPDETDQRIKRAIVDALPSQYRKVYDWIGSCYHPVTSAAVAKAWDLKQNHASTLLKELHDFGLLKRTEKTDEHGRAYLYEQA